MALVKSHCGQAVVLQSHTKQAFSITLQNNLRIVLKMAPISEGEHLQLIYFLLPLNFFAPPLPRFTKYLIEQFHWKLTFFGKKKIISLYLGKCIWSPPHNFHRLALLNFDLSEVCYQYVSGNPILCLLKRKRNKDSSFK